MKVKIPMTVNDRVRTENDDGVISFPITYCYLNKDFRFTVKTDNGERVPVRTATVEPLAVKESDLVISDPLNDAAVLEWDYDGRRILNTAQSVYCKIEENGLVTVTNLLDAGSPVYDTELPEGFPEIKITGTRVFEAKVASRDGKQYFSSCKQVESCNELTKEFTHLFVDSISEDSHNAKAKIVNPLPVELTYDKITFYAPAYNITIGDVLQFSIKGVKHCVTVKEIECELATKRHPANVTIKLKDNDTGEQFKIKKGMYRAVDVSKPSGLDNMQLF